MIKLPIHTFLPLFCLGLICSPSFQAQTKPDITLRGTVTGSQNHSYVEAPFTVPEGIVSITVTFRYTGRDQRTTLDLGLFDSERFRGWSGGNKDQFTISVSIATPSYLPGPLSAGQWKLIIGVPNIRENVTSHYEADIFFTRRAHETTSFADAPLREGPAWYRGDLHMHTAHSDGSCQSQGGKKVPCPVFLTAEAASARGLDFIAVTDHNTTSHYDALRELQPYFDKLLFIPGREITTFWGHANLFGPTDFVDFRVGTTLPSMQVLFEQAQQVHAILSINHPNAPTGEVCMGCGWTPKEPIDSHLITTIEAVNGGDEEGQYAGVSFWEKYLNQGYRVTAIGGSDNHNALLPAGTKNAIGSPTTVIYADNLSVASILDGIRKSHVFIDLSASRDRLLNVSAEDGGRKSLMGDALATPSGSTIKISAHVIDCAGYKLRFLLDGQSADALDRSITQSDQTIALTLPADGKKHWLRPDVITPEGKLVLLGNPIYLNHTENQE
ncbi:CehA/McbA family metallohydrolase [Alloacidobacterium sp.]|uniref:CehA/McbA family metallohydrolase n=1 Tax=Alloacidobacterium sp. TaxID=2951999 RepID=UPI002D28740B|nr:CehA/McbA family metallohydrolase [Alloacidobacterium sp.]HYK35237.1 CehA/McbA family metallohydrolase [Alloacidobacterium sp.]